MSYGYPDGIDGSHPRFNLPDEELPVCGECRYCCYLTLGGSDIGSACIVDAEDEGVVEQVCSGEVACERFELGEL